MQILQIQLDDTLPNVNVTICTMILLQPRFSDMLPLPFVTKDNYKVLLYRLADTHADKVIAHAVCLKMCNKQ